jgi:TPR repeat protein
MASFIDFLRNEENQSADQVLGQIIDLVASGDADASYFLWTEFSTGGNFKILDPIRARNFLLTAALLGHVGAKSDLEELNTLHEMWIKQANVGSGMAAYNLYESYLNGSFGAVDEIEAKRYLELAALHGYKLAKKKLKLISEL